MMLLQDSAESDERSHYTEFVQMIGWFFFNLFLLGYVEDPNTGLSFRLPGGLQWEVYIEVNLCIVKPHCLCIVNHYKYIDTLSGWEDCRREPQIVL